MAGSPTLPPPGRRLALLHRYNAWTLTFLVVSGLILYFPELRTATAAVRTPLKNLHILAGLLSAGWFLAYVAGLAGTHWRRLGERWRQKLNVWFVALLVVGWAVTGVIIWLPKWFPIGWSDTALRWHDILTWIGLPWGVAHSATRYWRVRVAQARPYQSRPVEPGVVQPGPARVPRRQFLRQAAALGVTLAAAGLSFGLWRSAAGRKKEPAGVGFSAWREDGVPDPAPSQSLPAGAGRRGRFRYFTVTDGYPQFSVKDWRFKVGGLVQKPLNFTWDEVQRLPRHTQVSNFHCVTGWSVYNIHWEGVKLSNLLQQAGIDPRAKYVKFISGDGEYTDALTLEQAHADDIMIAFLMDGKPISRFNGGPVRLVVPKMYAYKSVKWLQGIELLDHSHTGYWEMRGYDTDAWVVQEGKILRGFGRDGEGGQSM